MTNELRPDHNTLPLLGVSKWEGEEGGYAYVKAYMIMNNLYVVRVRYLREGSAFYFIRTPKLDDGFDIWESRYYNDIPYGSEDLEEDGIINHATDEVVKYAKENDLIPEEYDYDAERKRADEAEAALVEANQKLDELRKIIASYQMSDVF